jgi:bacterial/archaeal transporter family protein
MPVGLRKSNTLVIGHPINFPYGVKASLRSGGQKAIVYLLPCDCIGARFGADWPHAMKTLLGNWLAWAMLSALFAAATAILAKIGVAGINSNLATAIRTVVVVFFTLAIAYGTGVTTGSLRQLSGLNWTFLILSGMATGLSWLCYFRALQLGPASRVAPVDKLSVVFAVLAAVLLLGEKLSWVQWLGAAFITGGAVLMAL